MKVVGVAELNEHISHDVLAQIQGDRTPVDNREHAGHKADGRAGQHHLDPHGSAADDRHFLRVDFRTLERSEDVLNIA